MARSLIPSIALYASASPAPSFSWTSSIPQVNYTDSAPARGDSNKRRRTTQRSDPPPQLPCSVPEAMSVYDMLVRDGIFKPRESHNHPTQAEKDDPKFCNVHRTVGHPTKDCFTLRRLIDTQIKRGKLQFVSPRKDVNTQPFPDHGEQRPHVQVVIAATEEVHSAEVTEVVTNTQFADQTVEKLADNSKFKSFFDQLGFPTKARLEATRSLMEIAARHFDPTGPLPFHRLAKQASTTITFSDQDRAINHFHNRPLYVTTIVRSKEFPRTLLDGGASINIMPLKTFREVGIPENKLDMDSVEIFGFGTDSTKSIGSVTLGIRMGKIDSPIKFHIIDADTSYQLLIGRIWMHTHRLIPSTYHQCAKAIVKGKEVKIPATERPFTPEEAHFVDAAYFTDFDLAEKPSSLVSVPLTTEGRLVFKPPVRTEPFRRCQRVRLNDGSIVYRL